MNRAFFAAPVLLLLLAGCSADSGGGEETTPSPAQPVVTKGALTLGSAKTKVSGSIDTSGKGFRVDLSSRRCDMPGDAPEGTSRLQLPSADAATGRVYFATCSAKAH